LLTQLVIGTAQEVIDAYLHGRHGVAAAHHPKDAI
jgi:hypothetical protein